MAMRAVDADRYVTKTPAGWQATARTVQDAEAFRMQATALGRYLLMARDGSFLAAADGRAIVSPRPTGDGDWRFTEVEGDAFALSVDESGRRLGVTTLGTLASGGGAAGLTFARAPGCRDFPPSQGQESREAPPGGTAFGWDQGAIAAPLYRQAFG